ncbi:DUF5304 family protein [Streptodolium elevatio]
MKSTDGSDDPWAGVADPVPGARSGRAGDGPDDRQDDGGDASRDDGRADGPGGGYDGGRPRPESADRLAEEARRLAEAVAAQLGGVREEVREKVVEPLIRRHPEAAAHLGAAGAELLAAYRSFVADKERRWASRAAPAQRVDIDIELDADFDENPADGSHGRRLDDRLPDDRRGQEPPQGD